MMDEKIIAMLRRMATKYNTPDFIEDDPIQFPHKYKHSQVDAEISAILTSAISFGNRKQIIKAAKVIDDAFASDPIGFIRNEEYRKFFPYGRGFYRMISNADMRLICIRLLVIIKESETIEAHLKKGFTPFDESYKRVPGYDKTANLPPSIIWLSHRFDYVMGRVENGSPLKRINMLLRWMVRRDGIVDLGLWKNVNPKDLIIPLDTHVHRKALELGLTKRKTPDMKTAIEITDHLKEVFPDDPTLGDFALFGMGINEDKL